MLLLLSAFAIACEIQLRFVGREVLSPLDGATLVPPDILPSSTWIGEPSFDGSSGYPVAARLTDPTGADVPGVEELLANRVVFHPDARLLAGATYTLTGAQGAASFTVGEEDVLPPDAAPSLTDAAVLNVSESLPTCGILPATAHYHDLLGTLSLPTSDAGAGVIAWTRIHRVEDVDAEVGDPGTWLPSGTAGSLMRWLASEEDDSACFRLQEEDAAGGLSEVSEAVCVAVDPACGCAGVGSAPAALAGALAVVIVGLRRGRPRRGHRQ